LEITFLQHYVAGLCNDRDLFSMKYEMILQIQLISSFIVPRKAYHCWYVKHYLLVPGCNKK